MKYSWLTIIQGVTAILFGILAIVIPGITLLTAVTLLGLLLILIGTISGIFSLISGQDTSDSSLLIIYSILVFLLGVSFFALPEVSIITMVYLLAGWAFLSGIMQILQSVKREKPDYKETLLLLSGVASLIFAVLILIFPITGIITLMILAGIYSILWGVVTVANTIRLSEL